MIKNLIHQDYLTLQFLAKTYENKQNIFYNLNLISMQDYSLSNKTDPIARGLSVMNFTGLQNMNFLNDRNVFNKPTNLAEEMDLSNNKPKDYEIGMPLHNAYIRNNKKNLLNNPYVETDDKQNNFNELNSNDLSSLTKGSSLTSNREGTSAFSFIENNDNNNDNSLFCLIEMGIANFDYNTSIVKKRFVFDLSSPFGLSYIWKTLLLLSKSPTTDKLVKMLNIQSKDETIKDMKGFADVFNEYGLITLKMFVKGNAINTNVTNKIEEIYRIKFDINEIKYTEDDELTSLANINLNYNFVLKIPPNYFPAESVNYLINYPDNMIKFINLQNVICSMMRFEDLFNIEVLMGENMLLGFIYTMGRNVPSKLPYDFITEPKRFTHIINNFVFPKISKTKTYEYGKSFNDMLENVHLGEIIYGKLLGIKIHCKLSFNVVGGDIPLGTNLYKGLKEIKEVIINHPCYYYVRNKMLGNKILISGVLKY